MYQTQAFLLQPSCRSLTLPVRARSLLRGAETNSYLRSFSSLPSLFFFRLPHAATGMAASKCVPSFHIRPSNTASFRATATRARFGPTFFIS
jgi:hypothetical protein